MTFFTQDEPGSMIIYWITEEFCWGKFPVHTISQVFNSALPGVFASFDENTTPRFPFYHPHVRHLTPQRSNMDAKKKDHLALKDKLLFVTQENTKLLKEIASLKGRHMCMLEEIRDATSSNEKRASNDSRATDAASEKAKLKDAASRQEREVELLKLEIQSLRTKRGK